VSWKGVRIVEYHIPYGRQWIEEDDIQAVIEALKSDFLTTGPRVTQFEKLVAEYTGANYAVAVANGTAALHAACFAAGIGPGDEVITSPITFAASANCVLYCGGIPVFADIDPCTYNIDPNDIRSKITSKTKAIIPVHLAGQPCDMDEIHKIAEQYNLTVIEDGAHALGAEYKGKRIGSLSDMTTFSFHPVKPITTGEGGIITTNDENLYQKLIMFRSHGITRDPALLQKNEGSWYYEQQSLGYNYRITDIQCALGISQMKKLDRFIKTRRKLAQRYCNALENCKDIIRPYQLEGTNSGWHLYMIQIQNHNRKEIVDKLWEKGIYVNVHYIPVYKHPYYQKNGYRDVYCKNAECLYEHLISLPLYPLLTDSQQNKIVQELTMILEK